MGRTSMTEGGGLGLALWLSGKRAEVCVLHLKEEAREVWV